MLVIRTISLIYFLFAIVFLSCGRNIDDVLEDNKHETVQCKDGYEYKIDQFSYPYGQYKCVEIFYDYYYTSKSE